MFGLLIGAAIIALTMRDLLSAVAALTAYSLFTGIILALLGAVDVALTEMALGAGITGVLFVASISRIGRRSED
jgi:multicomponent Na+:H+ antiporter subunit B